MIINNHATSTKYSFLIPESCVVQPVSHGGTPDIKFHIAIPSYENVCRPNHLFRADMYVCQLTFYENTEAFYLSLCITR